MPATKKTSPIVVDPIKNGHKTNTRNIELHTFEKHQLLKDYYICVMSREASLMARKEVLTGKAKFGIFGDGKELPQVVLAHFCQPGDFRSGYYRDQTWMFATGHMSIEQFFAQLYADPAGDPFSAGRQMNCHFGSALLDNEGRWATHTEKFQSSSDISCTGGQMARALGLAQASSHYRKMASLENKKQFSNNGNEVSMVSIGDASTSEGVFWETINAAAVMQVPLAVMVWDDGYGISVPRELQTAKSSISEALAGFEVNEEKKGIDIHKIAGNRYEDLWHGYERGLAKVRKEHAPALFHITELTQPQGHSTSGSHERYKTKDQLENEKIRDCNLNFRNWLLKKHNCTEAELTEIEQKAKNDVKEGRRNAWAAHNAKTDNLKKEVQPYFDAIALAHPNETHATQAEKEIARLIDPTYAEVLAEIRHTLQLLSHCKSDSITQLGRFVKEKTNQGKTLYTKHLYANDFGNALHVKEVKAEYDQDAPKKNGYEILNTFFDQQFTLKPELMAFGEDVGRIGDVNQGFMGLQEKHSSDRIFDVGIREWTIMGQAIGLAMRGLRPIAEIQYLDYLIYGLSPLSDDLATLRWRSNGQQAAPAIIRTRGHRLEGVWHSGSPLGLMINSMRGIHICVPRNMTQAVGMYNTLLQSMDPGIVVECLNGYRLKEKLPNNITTFTVPLGTPEVLVEGKDITLLTYGSCIRIAQTACERLAEKGISVELIDIQTLLPFDVSHSIVESLKKTNRLLVLDEDVPGAATAYILQKVLEEQGGYRWLDSKPETLTAAPNRTPFGSDGDYFTKPSVEDVFEAVYRMMHEADPQRFEFDF